MSVGDSPAERAAVLAFKEVLPDAYVKSVSFVPRPSVQHLLSQLDTLRATIGHLLAHHRHVDYFT